MTRAWPIRTLAVVLSLAGCAATAETPLYRFVVDAEVQAEDDAQACLLAQALTDLATLPPAEAEARRYPGPPPRTAADVLSDHLVPAAPVAIAHEAELYAQAAEAVTRRVLNEAAARARDGRSCAPP